MAKILVLLTQSYPFEVAWEHTFLDVELHYLGLEFDRVILVPERLEGKRRVVPDNVDVDLSYSYDLLSLPVRCQDIVNYFISEKSQDIVNCLWTVLRSRVVSRN